MNLTIELTPVMESQLEREAKANGVTVEAEAQALFDKAIAENISLSAQTQTAALAQDSTQALFAQWAEEDAQMSPEQIEAERRMWEQFEAGINETRRASEMRIL